MSTPTWFTQNINRLHQSDFNEIADTRYHYLTWKNEGKPRIIFVHGALANAYWFSFLAPFFSQDFEIVCLSLPGHGRSDWLEQYDTEIFLEIIHNHVLPEKKNILIGHSLGAKLSLHYLEQYHNLLQYVILLDPPMGTPFFHTKKRLTQHHKIYPNPESLVERFRIIPKQPMQNPYLYQYIAQHSIQAVDNGFRWQFDPNFFNKCNIGKYTDYQSPPFRTTPIHCIYGENSSITTESVRQYLQKHYPDIHMHALEAAWHAIMIDQPLALQSTIQKILTQATD